MLIGIHLRITTHFIRFSFLLKIMSNYPFNFHFTSAIVSRVAGSLTDAALCQRQIREVINIDRARRQHQDYVAKLRFFNYTHTP